MNLLLIHGACHTGSCWEEVLIDLNRKGLTARAIDLPGHGSRKNNRPEVSFSDYSKAVADYIRENNWKNVVLVGHSMGGAVIQKTAEMIFPHLAGLVFLAGYLLGDGKSFWDNSLEFHKKLFARSAAESRDNTIFFPFPVFRKYFANSLTREEARNIHRQLVRTPYAPLREKLDLKRFYQLEVPTCYIRCTRDKLFPADQGPKKFAGRLKGATIEIEADHEAVFSAPRECAEAIGNFSNSLPTAGLI
ncbi:MAG: alpha/beta fold hydrolase [bacterium]